MAYYDDEYPKLNNYREPGYEDVDDAFDIVFFNVTRGLKLLEPHIDLRLHDDNPEEITIGLGDRHGGCLGDFTFSCHEWAKDCLSSCFEEEQQAVKANTIETLQNMIKAIEEASCEDSCKP